MRRHELTCNRFVVRTNQTYNLGMGILTPLGERLINGMSNGYEQSGYHIYHDTLDFCISDSIAILLLVSTE